MTIEQKITTFAINEAAWLVWLLLGLSMGVSVAVSRAITLLLRSRAARRAAARLSRFARMAIVGLASRAEQK